MPEPLTIIVSIVSLITGVTTVVTDSTRLINDVRDVKRTINEAQHAVATIMENLNSWIRLWTPSRQKQFSRRTYRYFWGKDGYQAVKSRLSTIKDNLKRLENILHHYNKSNLWREITYVSFKSTNVGVAIQNVRQSVIDLHGITRNKMLAVIDERLNEKELEQRIKELATLIPQSARLWSTLRLLHAETSQSEMLTMEPRPKGVQRYRASLWKSLKGDDCNGTYAYLRFLLVSQGQSRILNYETSDSCVSQHHIDPRHELAIMFEDQTLAGEYGIGLSLGECFSRISLSSLDEQRWMRQATDLDRTNAAIDIVEWALLTWSSPWTEKMCICSVYHALPPHDPTRSVQDMSGPLRALGVYNARGTHACPNQNVAMRRHLSLAVLLSALALTSQVAVVLETGRSEGKEITVPKFIVNMEGTLQVLGQEDLAREIKVRNYRNGAWSSAVEHCLHLDQDRDDKSELDHMDFWRYQEKVLEPLESYRQILVEQRSDGRGSTVCESLLTVLEDTREVVNGHNTH